MSKNMIGDKDINTYRSSALILTAYPSLGTAGKPIYWNGSFKIDAYGLAEVLNLKPKDICAYFKGEFPDKFLFEAEKYFRDTFREEGWTIGDFTEEEILQEVSGQKFFLEVAVPYVRDMILKSKRRDIEMCVHPEARDKYGLQVAEMALNGNPKYTGGNYKCINIRLTDSKRFGEIHFADIPMKNVKGKEVPCAATDLRKFGMSDKQPLTQEKEEFIVNVIDAVNGNRRQYKDSLCPKTLMDFRRDTTYSADILRKKL